MRLDAAPEARVESLAWLIEAATLPHVYVAPGLRAGASIAAPGGCCAEGNSTMADRGGPEQDGPDRVDRIQSAVGFLTDQVVDLAREQAELAQTTRAGLEQVRDRVAQLERRNAVMAGRVRRLEQRAR